MRTTLAVTVVLSVGFSFAQPACADDEKLGKVNFETSCKPDAQKLSTRECCISIRSGTARHKRTFEDVLKADPECGIAYWGIALSLLWNPHVPTPAKNLAEGAAMIAKGKSVGAKTQRERDYLDALGVMYADYEKVDHRTRIVAYAKAMEQLAQRYPNDDEAQIHYALALNTSASPADKTYANQLKGAAILEPIAKRQPQHPGVAHYLIHLYDYPPIAEKGLDAARRYAKIAPGGGPCPAHAVAHLHARRLLEGIDRFERRSGACREGGQGLPRSAARHGLPGLCLSAAGARQEGQGHHRRDERRSPASPRHSLPGRMRWPFRRRATRWNAATGRPQRSLQVRPSPLAHVQAITHFARALGAARSGNPEAAKADIAKLAELRDKLREAKDAYWSEQVDIQRQVATAWVLYAEGKQMTR